MNQLETNDLFKGAYFLSRSCELKETRLLGNDRVVFVIEGRNLIDEENRYRSGNALVDPLHLRENLNFLRDIMRTTFKMKRTRTENKGENYERLPQGVAR